MYHTNKATLLIIDPPNCFKPSKTPLTSTGKKLIATKINCNITINNKIVIFSNKTTKYNYFFLPIIYL